MVNVNDFVATPAGLGRVEVVHPVGMLGKDGKAPNVKVEFNVYGTKQTVSNWFHEDDVVKQS